MQLHHAPRVRVVLMELPARSRLCAVANVCSQNMGSLAPGCKKRVTCKNLATSSFKKSSPEARPPLPPLPPLLPSSYKANICYLLGGRKQYGPGGVANPHVLHVNAAIVAVLAAREESRLLGLSDGGLVENHSEEARSH